MVLLCSVPGSGLVDITHLPLCVPLIMKHEGYSQTSCALSTLISRTVDSCCSVSFSAVKLAVKNAVVVEVISCPGERAVIFSAE